MGGNQPTSYEEQKKAIENGLISFDLNNYFIAENIEPIYDMIKNSKKEENESIFSFWKYYYTIGKYEEQLKSMHKLFSEKQENYFKNPKENSFKEAIIIQLKNKDNEKIDEIFKLFCDKEDVYCPFIIFIFEEEDSPGKELEKIVPDIKISEISPSKVFTLKFKKDETYSLLNIFPILLRICSYYNDLGDRIVIWHKNSEYPIDYNLIDSEFNSYINIFCLGKTGTGKSTFLNKFFGEKRSKQGGTRLSTTKKIVRFGIDKVPIRIYDSPGFEDEKTINIVNDKLREKTEEMNNDRDTIHLILYFINNKRETIFDKMENKIIETLKTNNKDIRIIFIMTHSTIDPCDINIKKKRKKLLLDKIEKIVNNIKSNFGDFYSYENNYFQKNSIKQENIIFVNLAEDPETDTGEFGFDKIIESILNSISYGIVKEELTFIKLKILDNLPNQIEKNEELESKIKEYINKSYFLKHSTFSIEKDKAIEEATKLYNNMFTYKKIFATFCPIIKDFKIAYNKYEKYKFKKELKRIFGFTINQESFNDVSNDYFKMVKKFINEKETKRINNEKSNVVENIRDGYHKTEVNTGLIFANEVVGYSSYALLFNPITFAIGGVGLVGSSYISYKQFKKDCTEYFEHYKNHYEDYKYQNFSDCIKTLIEGINFLEKLVKK